jgi:hypothetical protein
MHTAGTTHTRTTAPAPGSQPACASATAAVTLGSGQRSHACARGRGLTRWAAPQHVCRGRQLRTPSRAPARSACAQGVPQRSPAASPLPSAVAPSKSSSCHRPQPPPVCVRAHCVAGRGLTRERSGRVCRQAARMGVLAAQHRAHTWCSQPACRQGRQGLVPRTPQQKWPQGNCLQHMCDSLGLHAWHTCVWRCHVAATHTPRERASRMGVWSMLLQAGST